MSNRSSELARGRKLSRARRLMAMLSVLGVLTTGVIVSEAPAPAYAATYPTWDDVQAARADQAASAAQVSEIQALLAQLQSAAAAAQADADAKGAAYEEAESKFFEATYKAQELRTQADAAEATAAESKTRAGQLAAQLARTGSNDLTLNLLLNGDKASDLLASMGQAGKVSESANAIYEKATQDQKTAEALTAQADVATGVLEGLKAEAQAAFDAAVAAQQAAEAAVAESDAHRVELEAQLAALTSAAETTQAQYEEGVRIEQERLAAEAAAAAERARQAAAAAEAAANASRPSTGGGSSNGAPISAVPNQAGWVNPAAGRISSGYGYRIHPVSGGTRLHSGTDIAGGCGIPIRAAHSGTVGYAGWYGTYGNWVLINNGDGISTGYAHIVNGGIQVRVGQHVDAGQVIAYVGTTGASTGCHLHYEVRINGVATNAVPFMQKQGIALG